MAFINLYRKAALTAAAFIIIIIGNTIIIAQSAEGIWKGRLSKDNSNEINLSFSRSTDNTGKNWFGSDFNLSSIDGLTAADISGSNRSVDFSIRREAGTIECTGTFNENKGTGRYKFTASPGFVSAMRSLGFSLDIEDLLAAVSLDISESFARGVAAMGFNSKDFDDVVKAKIFKITPEYAAEMRASGFGDLEMEDLVKARIFKIDAAFAQEIKQRGVGDGSMEQLVKLSIFKVTPDFIDEIRSEGFANLAVEDLVKMKIFNINGDYIRKARAENVPLNLETLVNRKIGIRERY